MLEVLHLIPILPFLHVLELKLQELQEQYGLLPACMCLSPFFNSAHTIIFLFIFTAYHLSLAEYTSLPCLICNSSISERTSIAALGNEQVGLPLQHKKDARGNQYHKYCSFPLRLWCFHLSMCPYQVGCNLIVNRYILKVPFSECSFIIPSEYFLSIITR